eukprot:784900_1
MGANVWANMKQDRFFYFNYPGFNWICNQQVTYKQATDTALVFAESTRKWIDNSMGNTVDIHFTTPFNQMQEIQCLQHPTNEPTQQPTVEPTLSPSSFPTKKPTLSPSQDPSKVPTFAPTEVPTYDPIIIPTIEPTNVPSIAPSNSPTKNPLVISAISSTLHSNSVDPENNTTEEGVNMLLYIAIISASVFVCGAVAFGYFLIVICIPKVKAQNRNKHAMNANHAKDDVPQSQNKVKAPNNALIPAENTQKMGNVAMMEVIHDANEVKQWLENIVHLPIYYDLFVDSGYETLELIELITNE